MQPEPLPEGVWTLDAERTTIRAGIRKLLIVDAPATLALVTGSIVVTADGDVSSIDVVIDAASFDSGDARRDSWATGPACLDHAAHPDLVFASRDVRLGPDGARAVGTIAVKGCESPVLLDVSAVEIDAAEARFRVSTVLDRKAIGLDAYPSFLISRMISMSISCVAARRLTSESPDRSDQARRRPTALEPSD